MGPERAVKSEGAVEQERAVSGESTEAQERAGSYESTERSERMSLDAYIDAEVVGTITPFVVDNPRKADWAMRRVAEARAQLAEVKAEYDLWRARIDRWLTEVSTPLKEAAERFEAMLTTYHAGILAEQEEAGVDDRRLPKTVVLPSGRLASRAGSLSIEVTDEDAFVKWAKASCPEMLRSAPDKAAIKRLGQTSGGNVIYGGEVVPGVRAVVGQRSFRAEPTVTPKAHNELRAGEQDGNIRVERAASLESTGTAERATTSESTEPDER